MQRLTSAISGVRRDRRCQSDTDTVASVTYRTSSDDREPFDRAAPSRSHTIRCDPVSDGYRQRLVMPRSQSVGNIDRLAPTSSSNDDSGNRFRKRLDVIRENLRARMTRKRSDAKDDAAVHSQKHDVPQSAVRQLEVPAVHQSEMMCNGADTSVEAPSSPMTPLFDRRRIQRRTPRRHRTVVVGEQGEAVRGLLRRNASSPWNASSMKEVQRPKVDDVVGYPSSRFADDGAQQHDVESDVTDTVSHDDSQQLPLTR